MKVLDLIAAEFDINANIQVYDMSNTDEYYERTENNLLYTDDMYSPNKPLDEYNVDYITIKDNTLIIEVVKEK